MKEQISGNLERFTKYYQQSPLKRLIVGIVVGGFLWLCFFGITLIFDLFVNDGVWWNAFLNDLPLVGAILALLISLQIWGLLPQPDIQTLEMNTLTENNMAESLGEVENIGNEDSNREQADSEDMSFETLPK